MNTNFLKILKTCSWKIKIMKGQRNMSTLKKSNIKTSLSKTKNSEALESNTPETKCPFLANNQTSVKQINQEDIIEINKKESFNYNKFFHHQILKKKLDHSYRIFKKVTRVAGPKQFPSATEYTWGKKPIIVWCSNDYLGMSCHPEVKRAAAKALDEYGVGSGGTRNISGNSVLHDLLEEKLAELHQKESALLFSSCFVANDSTLSTLARMLPECHIFSDESNHASIIQGIRNSFIKNNSKCNSVEKHIFEHNNPNHLKVLMTKISKAKQNKSIPKIVAFETVHSMTGTISPLQELCDITHQNGGVTFVDEVHAVGLYGDHGAGIGEKENQLHKMDIISGTLGKAFGNIGGYIAGPSNLVDVIRSYAPGFIFTTSLPPTTLAGSLKAIEILMSDEGRYLRKKHQETVKYLRNALENNGFPVQETPSHIIPVKIGNPLQCTMVSDLLLKEKGHYVQSINYPAVARGEERLRFAPTPYHTKEMVDVLIEDLKKVWVRLNLPLDV